MLRRGVFSAQGLILSILLYHTPSVYSEGDYDSTSNASTGDSLFVVIKVPFVSDARVYVDIVIVGTGEAEANRDHIILMEVKLDGV